MAATLTDAGDLTLSYLSFPIEKVEATPDGDLYVYGKATDETLDSDEQIIDKTFSSKALADWLASGANVRVQHNAQRDPAGVGVEASTDREGATWVKSLVVEPVAKRLVEKGALRAYSVGIARPKIVRDNVARGGRIVGGEIVEISLVDRPANKSCGIQLVKAAQDGSPEWVGKVFGADILTKAEVVNVDVPKSASITFSPEDLRKLLEHRRVAEERLSKGELSTDDRKDLPDKHFAYIDSDGNRHLPIHDEGHVKSALGRFNQTQFESDDAKRKAAKKILSRAKSMGVDVDEDSNVAQAAKMATVGASVTEILGVDVSGIDPEVRKALTEALLKGKKSKKPFPGAAPAFDGRDSDGNGKDADKPGSEEDDDTKTPPKVKPGSSKKSEENAVDEPEVEKGAKDCPKCGKSYHADSKQKTCENCGSKLPVANKGVDVEPDDDDDDQQQTEKASKPTPDGGAVAADIQPVPAHREPDGPVVESFERDAGLPTTPDSSLKAAMRLKSLGVPNDLGTLHDLLCPGYHPGDVAKCYPGQSLSQIPVQDWQAKALDAAVGAPLAEATKATSLWQNAVTIKGTEPEVLEEIRAEAHKSFQDANPGPGTFPTPSELHATSYRRAYISAGHANPGTSYGGPNTHSVPSGGITANQFNDGYRSAGRAEQSPSNKADAPIPAPLPAGEPSRVYYRNSQRDHAKAAMQAMHDHIANTFPDLCPMGAEVPVGQRPVPVPGAAKAAKKKGKAKEPTLEKAFSPDLIKSAVTEFTAPLVEQLASLTKALKEEQERSAALQKAVDALSDLADPREAPFKGVAMNNPAMAKAAGAPVGALSVAEIAERTQRQKLEALSYTARFDPDPGQREAAWAEVWRMTGATTR